MKTRHLSVLVILVAVLTVSLSTQEANAQSVTVSTDKSSYNYGENYTISGKVNPVVSGQMISIVILSLDYPHPTSISVVPNSDGGYLYTLPLKINDILSGNFTVIVQYAGTKNQTTFSYIGLPCNQLNIPENSYYSVPIIRGPPAYNPRIVDSSGNAITGPVKVGQQIQIAYTLANGLNCAQPFAYIVQIQDHDGITVSLSWITGTLPAGKSFNPAQSWTPWHNGTYTAQIFTWQSIDNPNALFPPVSVAFDVGPNQNFTQSHTIQSTISSCTAGFIHLTKKEDGSPVCVQSDAAQKLIDRGWAKKIVTANQTSLNQSSDLFNSSNFVMNLGNDTGIINWKNQTYYFETPNYTKTSSGDPVQILFHNVIFTLFPSTFSGLPLGSCEGTHYVVDSQFSDGSHEMLRVFVDSSCGYDYIPIKFSTHTNPQTGLTVYNGKMKLLTSVESK